MNQLSGNGNLQNNVQKKFEHVHVKNIISRNIPSEVDTVLDEKTDIINKNVRKKLKKPESDTKWDEYIHTGILQWYAHHASKYPLLTSEEEKDYITKAQSGDQEALNVLICSNFGLVASILKKNIKLIKSLQAIDLVQEWNMGIMVAVDKFDVSSENKFSTYAYYWINKYIRTAIAEHGMTVSLTEKAYDENQKVGVIQSKLIQNNIAPTVENISQESGYTIKQVQAILLRANNPVSIDAPKKNTENFTLNDTLENFEGVESEKDGLTNPEYFLHNKRLLELIHFAFRSKVLTENEKTFLILRFDFSKDYSDNMSLLEIAEIMDSTLDKVRTLQVNAIKKLKKYLKDRGYSRDVL